MISTFFRKCLPSLVAVICVTDVWAASTFPVIGQSGMVVSEHHLASKVGVDVLKKGGNAVDAAIAVGYALAVVYPLAGNIGGGGFMTIRFADGRKTFIDFREKAPLAAKPDMFLDSTGKLREDLLKRGHLAVATPGTVAGLELALSKYGTMKRSVLMEPAIKYAQKGFELDHADVALLAGSSEDLRKDPPTAAIFFNHGRDFKAGEKLVQKDLAATLNIIREKGVPGFYKGSVAKAIVDASQNNNGIITQSDLDQYKVREMAPIECNYRGYEVISAPPPSSGGVALCEMLNILEGYPLKELGFRSAEAVHYQIEAMRYAYSDRNHISDPDFMSNSIQSLISKEYASSVRSRINFKKAGISQEIKPGVERYEGMNTTHYSVIDQWGNAVSVTYTLNNCFGAKVTAAGTGVLLNDEMSDFTTQIDVKSSSDKEEVNAIAPGKSPRSSMTPTILLKDKKPFMIIGSPGGSYIITSVLHGIINVIDYGMDIQEATAAPRFHQQWLPEETRMEDFAISPETRLRLEENGQKFVNVYKLDQGLSGILIGAPGIGKKPVKGYFYYGAKDPRRNPMRHHGEALGY